MWRRVWKLLAALALALAALPAPAALGAGPAPAGLLLYNSLDSPAAITDSAVGPDGAFLGGGRFVPGRVGGAYVAGPGDMGQVSFPREALNYRAGTIEFWARISDIAGRSIPWGPQPALAQLSDPSPDTVYNIAFTSNDGAGNGGLGGKAGHGQDSGTGEYYRDWTYDEILGPDVEGWHHYTLVWDERGLPGVDGGRARVAVYLDGRLTTGRWEDYYPDDPDFLPIQSGALQLRVDSEYHGIFWGEVTYDELRVWDHARIPPPPAEPALRLIVSDYWNHRFLLFDGESGQYIREFIPSGSGGLAYASHIARGPDGQLYVSSFGTASVKRYDARSGAYLGDFVAPGSGGLANPDKLVFRGDTLYVSDRFSARVLRFDARNGAFVGTLVEDGALGGFIAFDIGPDGDLYAGEFNGPCIQRYDGRTGESRGPFICAENYGAWGDVFFGPDGWLYASRYHMGEIWQIDPATAEVNKVMACPGITRANYLAFGPDGRLYTNALDEAFINRFDVASGACLGEFLSGGFGPGDVTVGFVFFDKPAAPPFQTTPIRDRFARDDGALGPSWRGPGLAGYSIVDQDLVVGEGGPLLWVNQFGTSQEVFVTLDRPERAGSQLLLLKARGPVNRSWTTWSFIAAGYEPTGKNMGRLVIATHRPGEPTLTVIASQAGVHLPAGAVLGASAGRDGVVRVYLEGTELLSADAGPHFANFRGQVGLWAGEAAGAQLDEFGGGTQP